MLTFILLFLRQIACGIAIKSLIHRERTVGQWQCVDRALRAMACVFQIISWRPVRGALWQWTHSPHPRGPSCCLAMRSSSPGQVEGGLKVTGCWRHGILQRNAGLVLTKGADSKASPSTGSCSWHLWGPSAPSCPCIPSHSLLTLCTLLLCQRGNGHNPSPCTSRASWWGKSGCGDLPIQSTERRPLLPSGWAQGHLLKIHLESRDGLPGEV